ncbi:MAG: PepSY-like domain-containing protein [Alistipes sp.]|nr:PepSY-like domain-containing protein [Alistipes sp.]
MKKLVLTLSVFFAAIGVACADVDRPIEVDKLPNAAQKFLKQYFPNASVSLAKVDVELVYKEYDVLLTDGTRVDFNNSGEWIDVDCKFATVPEGIVPRQIVDYVAKNYPNANILRIERDRHSYEVSLSNRLELTFDKKFKIVDIDD